MEGKLSECEAMAQDGGLCVCKGGPTLEILKEVQRAYEQRIELLNKNGGKNKLQKELQLLRAWVSDLVEQNSLLARAVEEMEADISARMVMERRRTSEWDPKKGVRDKINELKLLNDTLQKENYTKEREIRKLSTDIQQCEHTIAALKKEIAISRTVPTKDEEVMTEVSSPIAQEEDPRVRRVCRARRGAGCGAGPATSTPNTSRDLTSAPAPAELSLVEPLTDESIPILDDSSTSAELAKSTDKRRGSPTFQRKESLKVTEKLCKCERNVNRKGKKTRTSMSFNGEEKRKGKDASSASDSSAGLALESPGASAGGPGAAWRSLCICGPKKTSNVPSNQNPKDSAVVSKSPAEVKEGASEQNSKRCVKTCHTSDSLLVIEMAKLCLCNSAQDENKHKQTNTQDDKETKSNRDNNQAIQLSPTPVVIFDRGKGKCGPNCRRRETLLVIEPAARCRCTLDKDKYNDGKRSNSFDRHGKPENTQDNVTDKPSKAKSKDAKVHSKDLKEMNADEKKKVKNAASVGDEKKQTKTQIGLNESIGASSVAGSGVNGGNDATSGSEQCAVECLQNKLLATMRILENKEETIRVQAQSVAVAQQRIAALTERANYYRRQLDQCQQSPRFPDPQPVQTADMCVNTDVNKEEVCQQKIVSTLRDNLSVIEELYRECFYETAKQEELIDLLRKSCADVRSMERYKSDQIDQLQNVVHSQKWSLDKCQDIAAEVEILKTEISNFLNSSNHDSQCECVCGLKEENIKLRQRNEELEAKDKELQKRVQELEKALQEKDRDIEKHDQQLDMKDREGRHMSQQVCMLRQKYMDQVTTCESLTAQLQHCQAMLSSKCDEVAQLQREAGERDNFIHDIAKMKTDVNEMIL
ncbi:PREDICTED: axoneme-associated protein mst101(2)-like [Papilio polytes]|uniref:axoneme-associated protein mst101(2)-like n=1 Tax=Papilio polytes TaxID=76194 RepID=UPI000675D95E|nr:PREDICTED: axoneme-associated protein mst101(2)-like [Papilio polytes]